jgi:uncharacterized alkaline shock family protein YloU
MAPQVDTESAAMIATTDGSTTLQMDRGKTIIANGVVAKIAGLAAREVDGVHDLVSHNIGQTVAGLARAVARQASQDMGVNVEVGQREAAVDIRMITEYGVNIPSVADAVRRNVTHRVESMTGLTIKEVNVVIVDLYFPGEPQEPAPSPRVQ